MPARTVRSPPPTVAARLGLGAAVAGAALARLAATGRIARREFLPPELAGRHAGAIGGGAGPEWCDAEVLRAIRRRSLAALRKEVEPAPAAALARFDPGLAGGGRAHAARRRTGCCAPSSSSPACRCRRARSSRWCCRAGSSTTPPPCSTSSPLAGEVVWTGAGALAGNDGWVVLAPGRARAARAAAAGPGERAGRCRARRRSTADQAMFFRALAERVGGRGRRRPDGRRLAAAVWELVWAGLLTNDTLAPVRALLGGGSARAPPRGAARAARRATAATAAWPAPRRRRRPARPVPRGWPAAGRARRPATSTRPGARWPPPTSLLDRYGLVTRGSGGRRAARRRLRRRCIRCSRRPRSPAGPAAATSSRASARRSSRCPARSTGCARRPGPATCASRRRRSSSPPPTRPTPTARRCPGRTAPTPGRGGGRGHQPARKAGALVVLVDGACVLYVERGGRTLLSFTDDARRAAAGSRRAGPRRARRRAGQAARSSAPTACRSPPPRSATRWSRPASGRRRAGCACGA